MLITVDLNDSVATWYAERLKWELVYLGHSVSCFTKCEKFTALCKPQPSVKHVERKIEERVGGSVPAL